jgi:uncharacterized protein YcbX
MIGRVSEIWRYPVKSMAGERLDHCTLGPLGLTGDRGWALRDETVGEIRGAKKLHGLMMCGARYLDEPTDDRIPAVAMTLPDGSRITSDDPEASARLSEVLGKPVTLWSRRPPADREHYRRRPPDDPDLEKELRSVFGRTPDEPLPDLSVLPPEIFEFVSPLGTYFDAMPLHLLASTSLAALAEKNPSASFDRRRFRPNFLIEPADGAAGFVEREWCGSTLRIGAAVVRVEMPTARCVMTTLPQADLPKDPSVLRTVVRDGGQNLGVYASIVTTGEVKTGDAVALA